MATTRHSGPVIGALCQVASVAIPAIGAGSTFTYFFKNPLGTQLRIVGATAYVGSLGGGTMALDVGTAADPDAYIDNVAVTTAVPYHGVNGVGASEGSALHADSTTNWQALLTTTGGTGSTAGFLYIWGYFTEPPTVLKRL